MPAAAQLGQPVKTPLGMSNTLLLSKDGKASYAVASPTAAHLNAILQETMNTVEFGIPPSRWIYGLPGVLLAQLLAQIPIAFLLLEGALRAISPSLEEASATMGARASRCSAPSPGRC